MTASAGSVSRVPAGDIEDTVVKSLKEHHPNQGKSATGTLPLGDRGDLAQVSHVDQNADRARHQRSDRAPGHRDRHHELHQTMSSTNETSYRLAIQKSRAPIYPVQQGPPWCIRQALR